MKKRIEALLGPAVVAAAGLAMLLWQWPSGPGIIIDFGRELYVPWRLLEGETLYTDIAWFNGPLSAWANALCFRVLGVGVVTLKAVNAAVAAALLVLLYDLLRHVAGRVAATAACVCFVTVFAFGNLLPTPNYSFLTPYSHELTHGLLLSVAAIWCVFRWLRDGRAVFAAGAGLCLGLAFLTKAEVFLAAAGGVGAAVGAVVALRRSHPAAALRHAALLAAAAALPVLAAFALLRSAMPAGRALAATAGTWAWVGDADLASQDFYAWVMGTDRPRTRAGEMLAGALWIAALLVPAAVLALRMRASAVRRRWTAAACFMVVAGLLFAARGAIPWDDLARAAPLAAAAIAGGWCLAVVKDRRTDARSLTGLALAVFALLLLAKIVLNVRLAHYGFALAMPAVVLAVAAVTGWIPAWVQRRGGAGGVFLGAALGALAVFALVHLERKGATLARKTVTVSAGADAIRAGEQRGRVVNALLAHLDAGPAGSLVVLPEGVTINYLARRVNPTPYINFMPPELIMFGEKRMLAALRQRPPDLVALVHRPALEYGLPAFGRDYGTDLSRWVMDRYEPQRLFGSRPFAGEGFGILLLRRGDAQRN